MIDFSKVITAADKAITENEHRRTLVDTERDRRISSGAVVSIDGYGDVPIQGGGSHDRNMQALGQVASSRIASGDTTTITNFRDALNVMHGLTPPQVMSLWLGAVAATEAIYAASWALKDLEEIPTDYQSDRW
ncbi:hypothetical protein ACLBWZ_03390 [Brucellaceae bacterium C25G]